MRIQIAKPSFTEGTKLAKIKRDIQRKLRSHFSNEPCVRSSSRCDLEAGTYPLSDDPFSFDNNNQQSNYEHSNCPKPH
jgi:hypothetical protein